MDVSDASYFMYTYSDKKNNKGKQMENAKKKIFIKNKNLKWLETAHFKYLTDCRMPSSILWNHYMLFYQRHQLEIRFFKEDYF